MSTDFLLDKPLPADRRTESAYRILLVDDEYGIRKSLGAFLEEHGYEVDTAADAKSALGAFAAHRHDLVLTDISMPVVSGLDLLPELKALDPRVEVIMITAYLDITFAIKALQRGAYDFHIKPFNFEKIAISIERARERQTLKKRADEALRLQAEKAVLENASRQMALSLARVVEERDKFNHGHGRRTAKWAQLLAQRLGYDRERCELVHFGALVHDVGKVGIDDQILNKPSRLDDAEMAEVRRHSEIGDYVLRPMNFFADVRQIVRHHHERWDGAGYPDRLAGEAIPETARIVTVADYFDSITSARTYRSPMSNAAALELIASESGKTFDPRIAGEFVRMMHELAGTA
ncbi:MAG TPA: HD domain-containing phosphohydrolase [Planctomycetota bacterium]|nr:HD domain-containing phosphohydrolase [Planctomycetota bacterium]